MIFTTYAERIGERKGLTKGLSKGLKKGKLETQRANVLRLLEMRFKKVPQRVTDKVTELTDDILLTELFESAFNCESLKKFEALLPVK